MRKGFIIGLVVVLVVLAVLIVFLTRGPSPSEKELGNQISGPGTIMAGEEVEQGTSTKGESSGTSSGTDTAKNVVEITPSGFSPSVLTIKKGERVTWINKAGRESWPASAIHPTHRVYPGSDINKCGTSEESLIFDACRGIPPGESWSFTFNEVGSWKYHDHLQASVTGTIVVE
ncbi:MAG: hypothetical protein KatS3mg001_086 [Candidatus Pacearchaeota archaeon]|nr:MAG: hypothetical protein KatS3mg001_086 [Candidatus Pacearchaeota archaeon]